MAGLLKPLLRRLNVMPGWFLPLIQAIEAAGELNPLDYTAATWAAVSSAVSAGQAVLADPGATQQQVNSAAADINAAISDLAEWTPAEEFAGDLLGCYYDPETPGVLFQDSAGTTPVTGAGQPVGLMLDQSRGLERGPELASPDGWAALGQHIIEYLPDGRAKFTRNGDASWRVGQILPIQKGRFYLVSVDVEAVTVPVQIRSFGSTWTATVGSGIRSVTVGNRAVVSGVLVGEELNGIVSTIFGATSSVGEDGDYFILGDLSVRELPGLHASQVTTAAKPTFTGEDLNFDGIDDRLIAGTVDDFIWMHDGSPVTIGVVRGITPNGNQQTIIGTTHLGNSLYTGTTMIHESRDGNVRFGRDGLIVAHGVSGFYTYNFSTTSVDAQGPQPVSVVLVYDASQSRTYVNGVLGATSEPTTPIFSDQPSTYPLNIGNSGGGAALLGSIKALVIFNKHLPPDAFTRFQHWLAKKAGNVT